MTNNDYILKNATLTCLNAADYGLIPQGAIVVRAGKIAWLGPESKLPHDYFSLEAHDLQNVCLTPGLIDCHTHLVYAGHRAHEFELRQQGHTYEEILQAGGGIHATVRATRAASRDDLLQQSLKRLQALCQQGVTVVEIKSGYALDLTTEIKILEVAKHLEQYCPVSIRRTFLGAHAFPLEFKTEPERYVDRLCEEMLPTIKRQQLAEAVDVFCENIAFNLKQTERVLQTAKQLGFALKCHAEQLSAFGATALAARLGAQSVDHLEYATEQDVQAMADHHCTAVLLPGAYYFLRQDVKPPVAALRAAGVGMAIATDCNPGTSPSTSLLLMMNMACVLFGLTPLEALQGVTRHAAAALGLSHRYGELTIGKEADFALWAIDHPRDLAYAVGMNPCVGVIKAGRMLGRD
jgi:imidazolonepropionase